MASILRELTFPRKYVFRLLKATKNIKADSMVVITGSSGEDVLISLLNIPQFTGKKKLAKVPAVSTSEQIVDSTLLSYLELVNINDIGIIGNNSLDPLIQITMPSKIPCHPAVSPTLKNIIFVHEGKLYLSADLLHKMMCLGTHLVISEHTNSTNMKVFDIIFTIVDKEVEGARPIGPVIDIPEEFSFFYERGITAINATHNGVIQFTETPNLSHYPSIKFTFDGPALALSEIRRNSPGSTTNQHIFLQKCGLNTKQIEEYIQEANAKLTSVLASYRNPIPVENTPTPAREQNGDEVFRAVFRQPPSPPEEEEGNW